MIICTCISNIEICRLNIDINVLGPVGLKSYGKRGGGQKLIIIFNMQLYLPVELYMPTLISEQIKDGNNLKSSLIT